MDYRLPADNPSEEEILHAEQVLSFRFPESYRKFLAADGLSELRISHRVLRPNEVVESQKFTAKDYVPFADNACGDLYCWSAAATDAEPTVYFADHETGQYQRDSDSFETWLLANRF